MEKPKKHPNISISNDGEGDISNDTLIDKTLKSSDTEDLVKLNNQVDNKTNKLDGENQEHAVTEMELNKIERTNDEFATPTAVISDVAPVGNSSLTVENDNVKEKNECINKVNETFVPDNPTPLNTERNDREKTLAYGERKDVKVNATSETKTAESGNIGSVLNKTAFGPYENSSVKQKVEAFEKLKQELTEAQQAPSGSKLRSTVKESAKHWNQFTSKALQTNSSAHRSPKVP